MFSSRLLFFLFITVPFTPAYPAVMNHAPSLAPADYEVERTQGSIYLPLLAKRVPNQTGAIGLGDFQDVTYNVLLQVGNTLLPVVLDTGSSDLWVLSTSCQGTCSKGKSPSYSPGTFNYLNMDVTLQYGDSSTGTHAAGPMGTDVVSLAGLVAEGQSFAAINDTNTAVEETGSSGILGFGFPTNSVLWSKMYLAQTQSLLTTRDAPWSPDAKIHAPGQHKNMATQWFPKILLGASVAFFDNLLNTKQRRQIASVDLLLSSFAAIGPLIPRLVARGELAASMFTVTLQRDAIQVGGNEGTLYIGELPPTVSNESLTWVPVRRYPPEQGGMEPPLDAPDEIYPIAWEIAVEEVYFDEIKLPRSQLSTSNISLSALIDTGNSLIRGPPDVVAHIQTMSGGSQFHCSTPHTLAFQIGGKLFPVDPRDFVKQVHAGDVNTCAANLAATDVPVGNGSGYLYSWNLGQPFLKGVLASFYYGSLSRPSEDPPRIGLLSTVPSDAGELLKQVVQFAEATYHDFSHVVESAPASLPPAYSTGIGGVPLAFPTLGIDEFNESSPVNSGSQVKVSAGRWRVLIGLLGWVTWEMVV